MKVKCAIVYIELSTRAKRILTAVAVPAILLGSAAVAYAGTLHVWHDGDTLTAADLNANFAAVSSLEAQMATLQAGLSSGCAGHAALQSVDAHGNPICTPANDVIAIRAQVVGATNGGSATADCPQGYSLIAAAVSVDQRTESGINGWTNGGVIGCSISGNTLTAGIGNYSGGSGQTELDCFGICVRQ